MDGSAGLLRGLGLVARNAVDERHSSWPRLNIHLRLDVDQDGSQAGAGRVDPQLP